jgi:hypothetical protein
VWKVAELVWATSECSTAPTAPSHNATITTTTTASEEDDEDMSRFVMDIDHGDGQPPAILLKKAKRGRRKIASRKLDPLSLQELDDAVASVASSGICHSPHRRDDDDAVSANSHTLPSAHDSSPAAYHRKVFDSIPRTELNARNRLFYLYGRGSMSVTSSSQRSRRSSASRNRRSRRKRGDSLERVISETILEASVNWNKDGPWTGAGNSLESSTKSTVSTDEILCDLIQAGAILEHEISSCLSASSSDGDHAIKQLLPMNHLLPTVLSDGGESEELENDVQPPKQQSSSKVTPPVFFKLNPGPISRRSIGTTASASATHTYTSSEDPFKLLDEQDAYSSVLWSTSEENGSKSTSQIKEQEQKAAFERSVCESTTGSKKDIKPSITDDGFPSDAATLVNQPLDSFFGSDWATFDSNDIFTSNAENKDTESNASPSSIADFEPKSRRSTLSVESNQARVATKLSI